MKKIHLLYTLGLLTIILVGWFLFLQSNENAERGRELGNSSDNSQMNSDIFPLYEGLMWGKPALVKEEPDEYSEGREYWQIVSGTIGDVENIYEVAGPFAEYYDQKLTTTGWTRDMNREASGPGSNISYYTKGNQFITIAYDSDFKIESDNSPSECPCDIRFSITSGLTEE